MNNKAEIRSALKLKRQSLDQAARAELSRQIINQVFEIINWDKITSVHSYLPVEGQNEVNTLPLLKAARQVKPEIKIATSWRDGREIKTDWLDADFQPVKTVKPGFHFGLIVVPMLAFDKRGFRLGYGGGFYDRFLAAQDDALTIGLCYEFGHLAKLPHEDHDIPLAIIATENNIYRF